MVCGRRFKSPGAMKHHVVTQHKDEEDFQYECRECGKFFDTADQLAKHSKVVHGEISLSLSTEFLIKFPFLVIPFIKQEPINCKYCHESFENRQKLTLHVGVLGKLNKCRNTVNGVSKKGTQKQLAKPKS